MRMLAAALITTGLILMPAAPAAAGDSPAVFSLTLADAQQKAEQHSSRLQASRFLLEAARAQAASAGSPRYPRADLNGQYFYQTHVPTQATAAGTEVEMGDNHNYSAGPVIRYTLFDGGQTGKNAQSARLSAEAREQEHRSLRREIRYSLNLAYARVELAATKLALTTDALRLALDQSADIDLRSRVGTASQLDRIAAHKEMLNYRLLFYRSQNELAAALRDLFALTGETAQIDTERPLPDTVVDRLPEGLEPPTLLTAFESLEDTLQYFNAVRDASASPGEDTPMVRSLDLYSRSALKAAEGQKGAAWPKLGLSAESRIAYPDLSKKDDYTNNIFSVNVSMPIWDARLNRSLSDKYLNEARAQENQKAQLLSDLARDHAKSSDAIASLGSQLGVSRAAGREAEEIARLTYLSYTAGRSTLLEVQSANLKMMEARVQTAGIQYELISRMAEMEYRSGSPENGKDKSHGSPE